MRRALGALGRVVLSQRQSHQRSGRLRWQGVASHLVSFPEVAELARAAVGLRSGEAALSKVAAQMRPRQTPFSRPRVQNPPTKEFGWLVHRHIQSEVR